MNLSHILKSYRDKISSYLTELFDRDPLSLKKVNRWGVDVIEKLRNFSLGGKLLRGSLVLLFSDMYSMGKKTIPGKIEAASAIEIIHSSLLVHDDIMDRDELRRGNPTIHYQYISMYPGKKDKDIKESIHFGESMAICLADIGFFMGFFILSTISSDDNNNIVPRILNFWSREFTYVGAAQMDDMFFETTKNKITDSEILNMYKYKTSRYTFSLPMITGSLLAGAPEKDIKKLDLLGEKLGIIFQIKDDELGLFGEKNKIGKPPGSDIKEGKNTIYISYLKKLSDNSNRREIEKIIDSRDNSKETIKKLSEIVISTGVKDKIDQIVLNLKEEASDLIKDLSINKDYQSIIYELIDYIYNRDK